MHLFTDLRRSLAHWLVVMCLCLSVLTPALAAGQDQTDAPVAATPVVDPGEQPDDITPTNVSVEPTEPAVVPTATDAPPTATDPAELPVEPALPSTPESDSNTSFPLASITSDNSGLTVNGQSGTAYVPRGGTHTLRVGDLTDADNVVPYYANLYGSAYLGEWDSANYFSVFPTSNCSGDASQTFIMDPMLPGSSVAVATIVNQTSAYSVRATQYLYMLIEGQGSDFAGYKLVSQASSGCVDVRMFVDTVTLMVNNSTTSPITTNEVDALAFTTNQPTGDGWTQSLLESTSDCYSGTAIATAPPGQILSFSMTRDPGTYWYIVRSQTSGDAFYSNCIMVTVNALELHPTLTVKGDTYANFVSGEAVRMYVQGYPPLSKVTGLFYPDSLSCAGTAHVLLDGVANNTGALDVSPVMLYSQSLSVRFYSYVDGNQIFTNCAPLSFSPTPAQLEVNGSLGPVVVQGDEIHLVAYGLPSGSTAYAVLGCDGDFEPDEYGQPIGDDGIFEGDMSDGLPSEFWVRVALASPSQVSTNCVFVQLVDYEINPAITVNGSQTPDVVEPGASLDVAGTAFPPNTTATVRAYSGASNCTGEPTLYGTDTDTEGNLSLTLTAGSTGPMSVRADAGELMSNCVPIQINGPSVEPTLHLTINGSDADREVEVGTALHYLVTGPWSAGDPNVGITTIYDCGPGQDGDGNLGVTVNDGSATYQGLMENCTYTFFGNMTVNGVLYKSNEIKLTPVAPTLHLTINGSDADREVPIGTSLNYLLTGPWSAGNPNVGITTIYDCGPGQDGDGNLGVTVNDGSATYQGLMENCTYTFFGNMLVNGVLYKSNEISLTPVTPVISLTANGKSDKLTVNAGDTVTVNATGNWEQQDAGLTYQLGAADQSCNITGDEVPLVPTGPGEATFTWKPDTAGSYALRAYWTLGDDAPLASNCVLITVLAKSPTETPSPSPSATVSPSPTATGTASPTATSSATATATETTSPTATSSATGTTAATSTDQAVTGLPSTGDGPESGSMWLGSATALAVAMAMVGGFVYRSNKERP